jgi:hypothetical protein
MAFGPDPFNTSVCNFYKKNIEISLFAACQTNHLSSKNRLISVCKIVV